MPILCSTQATVGKHCFLAMKKRISWNSAQTCVTEIDNHHGT